MEKISKITNDQILRTIRIFLTIKQEENEFFMHCTINELIDKIQEYWDKDFN